MTKTYTVKQVADILGYSTNSIYTFLKEKKIFGVRVGKGRYRISQEELDKLLHLKKTEESQQVLIAPSPVLAPSPVNEVISSLDRHLAEKVSDIPSLFDWFVGFASIIVGLTMVLFVRNYEEFSSIGLAQFLIPIKVNLLVAGIGLFAVNVHNQARKNWYRIFSFIISINLLFFSLILFINKDLLGFTTFGLLSLLIFIQIILNLKGIAIFSVYASLLSIFLPIILIINPQTINFPGLGFISNFSPIQTIIVWLLFSSAVNSSIWIFQNKQKPIYWISILLFSFGFVYLAYLYTIQIYWSRGFIFLLISLVVVLSSFWHKLNFKEEETRRVIISIFGDLLLVYLTIIAVIWVVQNNIQSYAKKELANKIVYGQTLIESKVDASKEKVISLSKDTLLIEVLKKEDKQALQEFLKNFFIYSLDFRRLLIADSEGNVLNIYPEVTIPNNNIAFREYFKVTKEERITHLSNLFETSANGEKTKAVVITSPIEDEEGNFIGILIASLDIQSLGNRLQQSINSYEDEYFLVLDSVGEPIIKPRSFDKLEDGEFEHILSGQTHVGVNTDEVITNNNRMLQVHKPITNSNWILVLRRSLVKTLNFNIFTVVLLNLIIVTIGLLVIIWNLVHYRRRFRA